MILSVWFDHFRFDCSVIPWYFADDTSSSLWLLGEMVRTV